MKAELLFTSTGPLVVLTVRDSVEDPAVLDKLKAKGVEKFLAYELPYDEVQSRYGGHFNTVVHDRHESDDLRILDIDGGRVFQLFSLKGLGQPVIHEPY